jgi:GH15 family glucan-1,4-alpha-glucosidase
MEKIQDHALIGDCRSAALVARTGALDWLCWPRFDSPPVFGRLLDDSQGQWSITPSEAYQSKQCYVGETVVLQTTFFTGSGKVVITDLMPVAAEEEKEALLLPEFEILRKVECVQGNAALRFLFSVGDGKPLYCKNRGLGIRTHVNGGTLILRSQVDLKPDGSGIDSVFVIREKEVLYFSLSFSTESPAVLPALDQASNEKAIARSLDYWERFSSRITYQGDYRQAVIRSGLVLKLMSHAPSGAIIAAPTTSLPEKVGGDLNWDYRYCWLRDASLTTHALLHIGLRDEAQSFVGWLLHATNLTRPKLKVLYDVYGRKPQKEKTLDRLRGYFDSQPVRVGNQAQQQEQLDIYGEVICGAVNLLTNAKEIDHDTQKMLRDWGKYICQHWQQDDAGMWEVRGNKENFTHSALLCWVGVEGLLKLHDKSLLKNLDVGKLQEVSANIARAINTSAWSEDLQTYTSTLRGTDLDANLLLLSWYDFPMPPGRFEKTYQAICKNLSAENKLLYRNRHADEGVFILCSLWAVQYLASGGGSLEEARALFEHILGYANDAGLLSEELDPKTGELLGNFPLAFTHSGVINAAMAIEKGKARL